MTAVDQALNESDLSYEDVFDTPRPEGYGVIAYEVEPSGFEFYTHQLKNWDAEYVDIFFDYIPDDGVFWMVATDGTDIQDYGYTESIDEASWAPTEGWSDFGKVEVILGHTYIIWTYDNHFAKVRITGINLGNEGNVRFDWAYQIDTGNPELKVVPKNNSGTSGRLRH